MGCSPWGLKEWDTTEATQHACIHLVSPLPYTGSHYYMHDPFVCRCSQCFVHMSIVVFSPSIVVFRPTHDALYTPSQLHLTARWFPWCAVTVHSARAVHSVAFSSPPG